MAETKSKPPKSSVTRRGADKQAADRETVAKAFEDAVFKDIPGQSADKGSSEPIDLTPKGEDGGFDFGGNEDLIKGTPSSPSLAPAAHPAVIGSVPSIAAEVAAVEMPSLHKYQALLTERDRIERQITALRDESREAAVAQARALLRSVGLQCSVTHIQGAAPYKVSPLKGKSLAKYRHKLTGETWSGRGREPEWMHDRANVIRI